jgi:hypothetical protein
VTAAGLLRGFRFSLRFAIAAILLSTAAGKLLDVEGFARVLGSYETFPRPVLRPLALAVPLVELALAAWLFSGRRLPEAAGASAILHGGYGAWSAISLARGLELPNCGCFGVFFPKPLTGVTILQDVVLVALSLLLRALARRAA